MRLWESVYQGGVKEGVGNHPNSFFNSSLDFLKAKEKRGPSKDEEAKQES